MFNKSLSLLLCLLLAVGAFDFGQQFNKTGELLASFNLEDSTQETASNMAIISDYNEQLRASGYGTAELSTGEDVPAAAITFYSPRRMESRKNYKAGVKIEAHVSNAEHWIRSRYGFSAGILSTRASSGTCEFGSNNNYMAVSNLDPESSTSNVRHVIPRTSSSSEAFGWTPWCFSIYFPTVIAKKHSLSRSPYGNCAKWTHNYLRNVDWNSDGLALTTGGYYGQSTITFLSTPSEEVAVSMYANGSISYGFQYQVGAIITSGCFTVSAPTVYATIWAR